MILSCFAGETQIPANEISKFQAGEALWKILCPPAHCADRGWEWPGTYSHRGFSGAQCRQCYQTKPGKTSLESSLPTSDWRHSAGVGYHPVSAPAHGKHHFPADFSGIIGAPHSGKFAH